MEGWPIVGQMEDCEIFRVCLWLILCFYVDRMAQRLLIALSVVVETYLYFVSIQWTITSDMFSLVQSSQV